MRLATLRINMTLYNVFESDDYSTDSALIFKGALVEAFEWDETHYSVWDHEYNGLCNATDLDFLDESN